MQAWMSTAPTCWGPSPSARTGKNYTVGTEHYATDAELNPTAPAASSTAQQAYIGNVNSKKFHLPTCPNLPAEKNQILFSSYDEAVAAGYTPCSTCIQ